MAEYNKWVEVQKGRPDIENKIAGGKEGDTTIYVARMKLDRSVLPGKGVMEIVSDNLVFRGGYATYDGKETRFSSLQVAIGDEKNFKWVTQSGPFNTFNVLADGAVPVQAGFEIIENGFVLRPSYVARAPVTYRGEDIGAVCGKVFEGGVAMVPYASKETTSTEYEVLVYIGPPSS